MSADSSVIQRALEHHTSGRFAEAEAIYREILQSNPNIPAALHLLGVACSQQGRKDEAIEHIQRAIALQPGAADFHSNLAMVYLEKRDLEFAAMSAQKALSLRPDHVEASGILGNALNGLGRFSEAIEYFQRSLSARPEQPDVLRGLAEALRNVGRIPEAEAYSRRLFALQPLNQNALSARGEALLVQRRYAEAAAVFRSIIDAFPQSWIGYNGLGVAFFRQGRLAEAKPMYEKSIELAPANPSPHNNAGYACMVEGMIEDAIARYQKALAIRPDFADAYNNMGNALLGLLELEGAMRCYNRALFFQPDHRGAHWNKSLLLLLLGDFPNGFRGYEWRWLQFTEERRDFRQPAWDGGEIPGKTILLHAEQGFGDTLQFVRFAGMVAARGAHVVLECGAELVPLLRQAPGISKVIARGSPLPPFDLHCPLLSLAYALNITLEIIPSQIPYLAVDESKIAAWRQIVQSAGGGLKVGIAWAGSSTHARDRERSASLELFATLADVQGVQFFSLQKDLPRRPEPPGGFQLIDLTDRLGDFSDTAALIANLDLVISVDTAVVHLAGALGRPVWTLLPFSPDWRWLLGREDSPWYPTMRLFRQPARRDWNGVFNEVRAALTERAGK